MWRSWFGCKVRITKVEKYLNRKESLPEKKWDIFETCLYG
jgi:hypothetical protein